MLAAMLPWAANAQTTVTIGTGTETTYVTPFNSLWGYSFVEAIYTADEITAAGGTAGAITSVSFYKSSGSAQSNSIVLYMKNVTKATFSSTSDYEQVAAEDIVFTGTWDIPASGWTTITLDVPFVYDGASNLLIAMHEYTSGYTTQYFSYTSTSGSVVTYHSDSSNPDPYNISSFSGNSYTSANRANVQLEIIPGDISCHATGALSVSNVTSDNATIIWGMPEDAGTYIIQYKTPDLGWDDADVVTDNAVDTTYDFSNMLSPNTTYNVRVANLCGNGDTSVWRNTVFTTLNVAVALPYIQDFETDPESISDFLIVNGGTNGWYIGSATGMPAEDASDSTVHSLYISNDNGLSNSYSNGSASDAYAVLDVEFGEDMLEWHLSFDYNVNGEGSSTKYDYLSVYLMDGGASVPTSGAPSGTALLYQSNLLSGWTHYDAILDGVIGTSKRIVFYWRNDSSSGSNPPAAVDNISIIGNSCMRPFDLTVTDETMDGATITWEGNTTEYAVYLSGAMSGYYTAYSNSYTFTGLNPSSTYTVQVRALCGDDSSAISLPVSFNTACDAISITEDTPWFEDFEGYTGGGEQPFVCWETPVTDATYHGPFVYCGYGQSCHSGVNSAEFKGANNMLVLPEFTNNLQDLRLSFWATATSTSVGTVEVGVITDIDDPTTFELLANAGAPGPRGGASAGNGNYMGPFDFNSIQATEGRIALRYTSNSASQSWNLDDFTVSLSPGCPSPVKTSVQASNVDGHNATITWVDNDDTHTAWTVYYREVTPTNDGSWESVAATDTTVSLTGLNPETSYEVYVVTNCGTQTTNPDATLTITFTTTVACPVPTALTLESVTTDEAVITWTSTADNFNVEYGPAGFTPGTGTAVTVSENTITLDNLTPSTSYSVIVVADCGTDDGLSGYASISFTTTQVPVDLPYAADFSDSTDAWLLNNGSCSNVWMIGTANNVPALFITNDNSTPGYNVSSTSVVSAEKLVTVGDNASLNISFDLNIGGESSWDYLKVFFAPATESYPAATSSPTYATYSYSTYAVDFSDYLSQTGYTSYPYKINLTSGNTLHVGVEMPNPNENPDANSTAKLVFLWKNDSSSGTQPGAVISNVTVSVNNCPSPTALADSNITTSTADIYWTPGDEETEWVVEYGLQGFTPGTGEMENVSGDPAITLTDLATATAYDVYVVSICGSGDSSLWVGPLTFFTACDVITDLPFTENFNGYSASTSTRPNCWSFPITYSNAPYITSSYSSSAPNSLYFQSLTTTPTTAVTPQFAADINTLRVQFALKAESTTNSGTFEVGVMSDPNDVSTFESVQIIQPANTSWNQYTVNLSNVTMTGGNRYIAFRQNSNSSVWYYWLDDVTVMEIPACLEPNGLAASNATTTSVDLTWISDDNDFNVYYKKPNDADWSVEQNVSLSEGVFTLNNLTPSSTYFWKVANNCSDGTESMSVQSTFSTLMEAEVIPYSTDFAEDSDQAWLLNNGSCSNYWTIGAVDTASALFVTNNGTTPGYSVSAISIVSAEKLFTVGDAAEFNISFDVQCGGETSWDYLKVFLAPASSEYPAATTLPTYAENGYSTNAVDFSDYLSQTGYSSYPYKLNLTNGNTLHVEVSMPNPNDVPDATSTAKLVFLWRNDSSSGTQPGAVIYNVSISALACPKPTNLTVTNVGQTSADLSWTPGDEETAWNVEYKESSASTWNVIPVTTPSYQLTNLTAITAYDVRVQADCESSTSQYATASFSTEACDAADQCTYTFNLTDSYGDGWNNGYLEVQQNGVTVATIVMLDDETATETVQLCDNVSTSLVWNSGSYDDEAGFSIVGPDGTVLFSQDDMENYSTYTFTTDCSGSGPVITDPTVATVAATAIAQTSATLNATITNPDNVTITAKGFEWKATAGGTYTQIAGTGSGNTFTANLSGLTANTGYTYKAFITFEGTTVYGEEMTFTTLPEDTPEPCNVPTNLHTTDIQNEAISIAWDADANVTSWNIQYRPVGGTLATATTNTNSYTITGLTGLTTYEIQVQANCGNGNLSDWTAAITPQTTNVGIESYLINRIALYPNPAKEYVDIHVDENINVTGMEVYDVYGKLINTVNVVENPTRINVSGLANGMYFVRVTTEEGTVTKTFVKK